MKNGSFSTQVSLSLFLLNLTVSPCHAEPRARLNSELSIPAEQTRSVDSGTARAISKQVGSYLSEKGFLAITSMEEVEAPRTLFSHSLEEEEKIASRHFRVTAVVREHGAKADSIIPLSVIEAGSVFIISEK